MSESDKTPHQVMLLFAGWLIPGSAHWLLGKTGKAVLFLVLIVGTFVGGMLLSHNRNVYYVQGRWTALTQMPAGIVAFVGTRLRQGPPNPAEEEGALFKVGTLYTSVAGLLNIVVVMDAVHLGWLRRKGGKR